jgi:GMP synthase-like glutamine amidotransferase
VLISSTRTCKNQAFRFKSRLFGFQYHIEMTEGGIEALLSSRKEDVAKVHGPEGEQRMREETKQFYPRYARLGDRVLGNFVQFLKAYDPHR